MQDIGRTDEAGSQLDACLSHLVGQEIRRPLRILRQAEVGRKDALGLGQVFGEFLAEGRDNAFIERLVSGDVLTLA